MKLSLLFLVILLYNSCTGKEDKTPAAQEITVELTPDEILLQQAISSSGPGVVKVEIKGMVFEPKDISVNKGDTVLWMNKDIFVHDVTEIHSKKWTSQKLEPGTAWAMIINEPAEYFCSIHVIMKGSIKLNEGLEPVK